MANQWYLSNQLKQREVLENAGNWKPASEIGYLDLPCACGKTTATLNGSLQTFVSEALSLDNPIEKKDTSLWLARKAPIEQILTNARTKDLAISARNLEAYNAWNVPNLVTLGTVQSISQAYNNPTEANREVLYQVNNPRRLVVFDEAHLLSDMGFSAEMNGFVRYLEECVRTRETRVVLITSTMEYVRDYAFNQEIGGISLPLFDLVGKQLPTINSPQKIEVVQHSTLETVVSNLGSRIDSTHKMLVIARTAKDAYKIVQERNRLFNDAALAVASTNALSPKVNKENVRNVLEKNCFSQGINLLVATNIFEAGIELKDERLKFFATDSNTEIGIVQGISRARDYPLELAVIVQDGRGWHSANSEARKVQEVLRGLDEDSQKSLERFYQEQQESIEAFTRNLIGYEEKLPSLVYKSKGKYFINNGVRINSLYKLDNAYDTYTDDEVAREHYQWICERYESPLEFTDGNYKKKEISVARRNSKALSNIRKEDFASFIGSWFRKDSEETKRLQEILAQKNLNGTKTAISGLAREGSETQKALNSIGLALVYRRKQIKGVRQMAWTIEEL